MDSPLPRLREQRRSAGRRLGVMPGRRLALAAVVVALASLGYRPAAAMADPSVASATIYPGSGGGVSTPSVLLSTLESGCPLYSGSSPMTLYPGGQPYQPTLDSSWALSTVLQCGLQIPLSDVTGIEIDNPHSGFELPLTSAELTDPTQFHDPAAPYALPVISNDTGEDPPQITYTRPWLGGSDANGDDHVVQTTGPITLVVYENGPPLQVTATSTTGAQTATAMSVAFSAIVHGPNGVAIPAAALAWTWSFGDTTTAHVPAPTHSYTPGDYYATVQVTDASAGLGGTATVKVIASTSPASGATPRTGAGTNRTGRSPTGSERKHGTTSDGSPRKRTTTTSRTSSPSTGSAGDATDRGQPAASTTPSSTTSSSTTPSSTTTPAHTGATIPSVVSRTPSPKPALRANRTPAPPARRTPARHTRRTAHRPAAATVSGDVHPLVRGLLIGAVTPLAPGASPLVRTLTAPEAPTVRQAVNGSSQAAIGAGLAVVLLLALGAGRELSWRPRRSPGLSR